MKNKHAVQLGKNSVKARKERMGKDFNLHMAAISKLGVQARIDKKNKMITGE